MKIEVRIIRDDAGQRADRYLRRYLAGLSLARIHGLFRKKDVKVNRKPVPRNHLLGEGEVLEIYGLSEEQAALARNPALAFPDPDSSPPAEEFPATAIPKAAPFAVLHEDGDLLVVDKPAGLAVHPGTGIIPGRSLIELAQAYLSQGRAGSGRAGLFQPALVHRLDKETSGVLIIAKSGGALRALTAALRAGELRKEYLALIEGRPEKDKDTLRDVLDRVDSRSGGAKSQVSDQEGKEAITHYEVVERLGPRTLVRAIIETGRMHQIRAQFTHAGWPLAGDRRYGQPDAIKSARETLSLRRLFLHAEKLAWKDGWTTRTFIAPLPEELARALALCREGR